MNNADNGLLKGAIDSDSNSSVAEIYQRIERLSPSEKAALTQHLLNTNELKVIISSNATINSAVQLMNHADLGDTLEAIAMQVRRLDR